MTEVATFTKNVKTVPMTKPRGRPGRKSDSERAQIQFDQELAAKRLHVESKRAVRQLPDTKHSLRVAIALAAVPLATAGLVSYFTTVSVAVWMKLPIPALDYVVPGMLEALVIFCSIDYIISESRAKNSGRGPFMAMIGFSAINVLGNAAHTIVAWGPQFGGTNWQSYIGVVLSAAAPLVVVFLSKRISVLVFAEAV